MTISFSGLASGLDTSSWIESLVALRRAKVTTLQEEREAVSISKDTLSSIKNFFNSFRSTLERITDSKFNIVSMDLFAQNIATSANLNVLTATATQEAEEGTYKVKVDKLATQTKAVSGYKHTTTIVETTTATANTKLSDLNVKNGYIKVSADGNVTNIAITKDDTIATFIDKLQSAGVEASYNERTGVFSMNVSGNAIEDIDNTGIKDALHIDDTQPVEGYATQNALQIKKEESYWTPANNGTKLRDLGVLAGTMVIRANDEEYDVTIDEDTKFGEFVQALRDNNIDANLDEATGIFTLNDAVITDVGSTNIINALGIESSIYSKSQSTDALAKETVITSTTTATPTTLLREIGEGTPIADDSTVIVKNSNNEYMTITVGSESTIGDLLGKISDAGLYATINADGTVEISGGAITGGSFDAVNALGLQTEPFSAMVTGSALLETVVRDELVTPNTRLVEDLNVTEGYIEITDTAGKVFYEKIEAGQTILDFASKMANYGINVNLDTSTGVLSITGGGFRTLTDEEAVLETGDDTATGTNLLARLYGSDVISTDHIDISSSYAKSRTLTHTTTTVVNADPDSTLGSLGLTTNGTAEFNVRGELRTINVSSTMSINQLMNALDTEGISATWDSSNSKISFNNATLTGGTSDLSDVLNLTETISGKYVTSDPIYAKSEFVSNATESSELSLYGIDPEQEELVYLYREDRSFFSFTVTGSTSLGELLGTLNTMGVTATLDNGIFSIDGGYLENANLKTALGLNNTINGQTSILGNEVVHTVTTAVTGSTTMDEIINALGTSSAVAGGYDLVFNSTSLTITGSTTLNDLMEQVTSLGGTARLESTGRLHIDGGTLTGNVATALGFTSQSVISSVNATGETLTKTVTVDADKSTKLSSIGVGETTITVHNADGTTAGTVDTTGNMTIQQVFDGLSTLGVVGTMQDGVISLTSADGKYISGDFATAIGMSTVQTTTTTTTGLSVTSSAPIVTTQSIVADSSTKFGELGFGDTCSIVVANTNGTLGVITTSADMTLGEMISALAGYGISGTISDGVISLNSSNGAYITGDIVNAMGIQTESSLTTIPPGKSYTSTVAITFTETVFATGTTQLKDLGILADGVHLTKSEAEALGYTWVTTGEELEAALTNSTSSTKVMLGCDIDLSSGWSPIADFKGTFDGNNYAINNMVISTQLTAGTDVGFFAQINEGAEVRNLTFSNSTISISGTLSSGAVVMGVLAGRLDNASVMNVTVKSSKIESSASGGSSINFAGLVGRASQSSILCSEVENTSLYCNNNSTSRIAGVVAISISSLLSQVKASGINLGGETPNNSGLKFGGLVGTLNRSKIINSEVVIDAYPNSSSIYNFGAIAEVVSANSTESAFIDEVYIQNNIGPISNFGTTPTSENVYIKDIRTGTAPDFTTSDLYIADADGNVLGSISIGATTTIDDILAGLVGYGITGAISNGQIVLNSPNGNYVFGAVATQLGIDLVANSTSTTVGDSATSTAVVTYTQAISATLADRVGDYIAIGASECDGVITTATITGTTIGISTAEDLANLSALVARGVSTEGKTFVLLNDIDLSGYANWTSIGSGAYTFNGTFDGQGYTISNLKQTVAVNATTNIASGTVAGLFGVVKNATIKDVNLDGVNIEANAKSIGALVGYASNSTITDIEITGLNFATNSAVVGATIGGAVGCLSNESFDYSVNNIKVEGDIDCVTNNTAYIGGVFGKVNSFYALNHMFSNVDITSKSQGYVGGISGYIGGTNYSENNIARYCANIGDLASGTTGRVGGLFGYVSLDNSESELGRTTYYLRDSYNADLSGHIFIGSIEGSTLAPSQTLVINNCGYAGGSSPPCGSVIATATYVEQNTVYGPSNIYQKFTDPDHWIAAEGTPSANSGPVPHYSNPSQISIKNSSGSQVGTIQNVEDMTFEELFTQLSSYGINCSIDDGVISVESTNGNYVDGEAWKKLGFEVLSTTTSTTTTTPLAVTSTAKVTYTKTTTADATTTLGSTKYVFDGSITSSSVTGSVIAISTATQLKYLANQVNNGNDMAGKTFVLTADIDLSGTANWTAIGNKSNYFSGNFDGQGYTISNMKQNKTIASDGTGDTTVSLFGNVENGTIKNFTLKNAILKTENNSPSTVGQQVAGVISSAYNENVSGIFVENISIEVGENASSGGVLGTSWGKVTISNCKTSGVISASEGVISGQYGGIIGRVDNTGGSPVSVDNCQNEIDVSGNSYCVGGIVGLLYPANVSITNVLNKGDITGSSGAGGIVGFVRLNSSSAWDISITNAINMGKITATGTRADIIGCLDARPGTTGSGNLNMTACLGYSTSTTNTNIAYQKVDNTASGDYWTNYATITETACARNLSLTSMKSSTYKEHLSYDKWTLGTNVASTSLKIGDEYDIFVYNGSGVVQATLDLNASNTIQDVVSGLQGYGSCSFSNGKISYSPTTTFNVAGTGTTFINTTSALKEKGSYTLTNSTTFREITGRTTKQTLTIRQADGTSVTLTFTADQTVEDMLVSLAACGINGTVADGKLTLNKSATGAYITGGANTLENGLNLDFAPGKSFTVKTTNTTTYANSTESNKQYNIGSLNIDSTIKLSQLGLSSDAKITVVSNGTESVVTLKADQTINDMLTTLAGYNISGSVSNGKLTLQSTGNNYVSGMDSRLLNAFKISSVNDLYSVNTEVNIGNVNNSLTFKVKNTESLSNSTTLSELGVNSMANMTISSNGISREITLSPDKTIGDIITTLASYGITADVSDGKLNISGNENVYVSDITSNLTDPLKMMSSNVGGHTEYTYSNSDSNPITYKTTTTLTTSTTIGSLSPFRVDVVESQRVSNVSSFSSGQTYYITDVEDLVALADLVNSGQTGEGAIFELASDIDLGAYCDASIANGNGGWTPIGTEEDAFSGTFNGNGHVIKNLKIDRESAYQGLFGHISEANINNVGVEDSSIKADVSYYVGGLVGYANQSSIYDSYAVGTFISEECVGGLVGYGVYSFISNSYATGTISASSAGAGGLVGLFEYGTISNSYTTGDVSGESCAGGLVGLFEYGTISNSYATGDVSGEFCTGGLIGEAYRNSSISNCYATGTVSGGEMAGGLVAYQDEGVSITNCYVTGTVSGNVDIGGLVGYVVSGDGDISGCASVQSDSYATQMTEEQIKSTYTSDSMGFTKANGWAIGPDGSPVFGWQLPLSGTITVVQNGTEHTVTVNSQDTVADVISKLSTYGIYGSVSDGKLTLSGNENSYLKNIDESLADALGLAGQNTTTEDISTTTTNTNSRTLTATQTLAAIDTTELGDLHLASDGSAPAGYELVISKTASGNTTSVTVTFTATSTLDDVIETLDTLGIQATITSSGKFKVSSDSLSDFDISGDLGNYLMGSYTKNFNETSINNTTGILSAQTEIKMDDETKLSDIGITSGNIQVDINGSITTIAVDATKTVGDLRLQLAVLGITGDVINGKIALNANGVVEFDTPIGGSNAVNVLGLNNVNSSSDYAQTSKKLTSSGGADDFATMQNQISKLKDFSGNNLGITSGQIYVYQDGTRNVLNIDANETLESLASKLSQYGINMGISSDGRLYFDGNNNSYLTTEGLASDAASNILEKLNVADNWSTRYNSSSEVLKEKKSERVYVDGSAKIVDLQNSAGTDLNITEGNYYVYRNGVRYTESISADTTVNEFLATLAGYGMTSNIAGNGTITVRANDNAYLETSNTGCDTNAVDILFGEWNFVKEYSTDPLTVSKEVTTAITKDTKLADIDGANYQEGLITVVKDGVSTNIELNANDTVGDLIEKIKLYGFESVVNSNGELIIKNTGDSTLRTYSGVATASNALEILGIDSDNWINTNTYESGTVSVITTVTDDVSATRDTLLSELGVTSGEYYIYKNGVKYTALISSDETIGSFMNTLESFGIQTCLMKDGIDVSLAIVGNGDSYIAKSNSISNASNIVDLLFTSTEISNNYIAQNEVFESKTLDVTATEDTLLSVYDNGALLSAGDLSVTVNGLESTIRVSSAETIGSFIEKLQGVGMEATYLDGKIVITNGSINATGTTSNVAANLGLVFSNDIAEYTQSTHAVEKTTTTIEEKTLSVANYADYNTKLGLLGITSGSLTVYRSGEKAIIQVDANQTFDDLRSLVTTATSGTVDIKFEDGYIEFYSATPGVKINVGVTTDTSNFVAITGLATNEDGNVKSSRELYCVNSSSKITEAGIFRNGDIKEGSFRIGNADFTVTSETTISDIISQINASQESGATAYWDSVDGKFVITSRTTGASLVNIEAGTSNFTDVMGLTSSEWADADSDGNPDIGESLASKTKINVENQTIGENARFAINGTYYTSTSNTITSDVSKIKGLTINLKGISEGEETTITIERDKETLANAVSDVVDSYNDLIENIDKEIAKGSPLDDQFTLKLLRNQIRNLMTGSIATSGVYKNLSSIGISLEEASASNISTQNINKLYFDKDKFMSAFDADRDSLKNLLVGTGEFAGVLGQLEKIVEDNAANFFMSAEKSYTTQISRLDSKISKAETSLERYRARLEKKFESMDLLISQIQNQYSSFLGV